jgi:Arginine/lysine/ornithine decarboxylases
LFLLRESKGRVSWGIVAPYPPGIPVLAPGMVYVGDKRLFGEIIGLFQA